MMRPTNIPAMAPYDAGAIAGMVLVALVTIVIILMFVNSTVFHMLALTSFFVLAGTETGRSRRRSGRRRRRAGLRSELIDCKLFCTCITQIDYIGFQSGPPYVCVIGDVILFLEIYFMSAHIGTSLYYLAISELSQFSNRRIFVF